MLDLANLVALANLTTSLALVLAGEAVLIIAHPIVETLEVLVLDGVTSSEIFMIMIIFF